jgi:hypothetical protein
MNRFILALALAAATLPVQAETLESHVEIQGLRIETGSRSRLPPLTQQCVWFRSVSDWHALDEYNLLIWAPSRKHPYLVELDSPCREARWAESLAFSSRDSRLCGYGGDRILVGRDRCSIGAIHKLTPE